VKNKSAYLSQALSILNRTHGADCAQIRALGFLQRRLQATKDVEGGDKATRQQARSVAHQHAAPPGRS
jgi:hypothetical protein